MNGFEEIIQAGELAKKSPLEALTSPGGTLTERRRGVNDRNCRQALALLRAGLSKPLQIPQALGDEPRFRMFSSVRSLARLIAVEQYVLLADGKVGLAIDSLRDGLRLGYAIQSEMIIGGFVGIAIDATVMSTLMRHLDQLSVADCRSLMDLAAEWLSSPDSAIRALQSERTYMIGRLTEQIKEPAMRAEVLAILSRRVDRAIEELKKPAWERQALPPLGDGSQAELMAKSLFSEDAYSAALSLFTRELAKVQILGVHASIRAYRWEHDQLPATLEELDLGRLGIDPFTGKPLLYRRTSETTYELTSEGIPAKP